MSAQEFPELQVALRARYLRASRFTVPATLPTATMYAASLIPSADNRGLLIWWSITLVQLITYWPVFVRPDLSDRWHRQAVVAQIVGGTAWALLPILCAGAPPLHADTNQTLSEQIREEVVVSAARVPREARLVGSAVTVLGIEDIDRRRVHLAADLLREVPGTAVNRTGQIGNVTQLRIRGAEGNHTLLCRFQVHDG